MSRRGLCNLHLGFQDFKDPGGGGGGGSIRGSIIFSGGIIFGVFGDLFRLFGLIRSD